MHSVVNNVSSIHSLIFASVCRASECRHVAKITNEIDDQKKKKLQKKKNGTRNEMKKGERESIVPLNVEHDGECARCIHRAFRVIKWKLQIDDCMDYIGT